MRAIEAEISSQPDCWRRAAALAATATTQLPPHGTRVAAIGCGTSLYVARAYAALREQRGFGETDAFAASEFPATRAYDWVLAISRSATTSEIIRVLGGDQRATTTLITAAPGEPAAQTANRLISLEFADEQSVVQTRFATSVLALLRAHLGEDLELVCAEAEHAITEPLPQRQFAHFVFLGRGFSVGIAEEAALKLREAAAAWSEAYPAPEYRHGPISAADEQSLVWMLQPLDSDLVGEIRATGATVLEGALDPLAELTRIHRLAVEVATARGLDPEHPRHLSRSVVLDGR